MINHIDLIGIKETSLLNLFQRKIKSKKKLMKHRGVLKLQIKKSYNPKIPTKLIPKSQTQTQNKPQKTIHSTKITLKKIGIINQIIPYKMKIKYNIQPLALTVSETS